ncbi:MAG TPA: hypothetical protein VLM79_01685, partial [Kofleriaceae bacterium]|nr:hypothetical protein [Kofleriaceae bacterium]
MTVRWCVCVFAMMCCRLAGAETKRPSDAELLPIDIPASTTSTTTLADDLRDACESIAQHASTLQGAQSAQRFSREALRPWQAARKALASAIDERVRAKADQASVDRPRPGAGNGEAQRLSAAADRQLTAAAQMVAATEKTVQAATSEVDKERAAAANSTAALHEACTAIAKGTKLSPDMIASLHEFKRNPSDSVSLVKMFLDAATGIGQSPSAAFEPVAPGSLETALINGLTNFVYQRAKAEALDYLADTLKGLLCADDRKPFFANICIAFDDVDKTVSLSAIGSFLATAARKDLERLPDVMLVYALSELTKMAPGQPPTCGDQQVACEALTDARVTLAFYHDVSRGRRALDAARALHAIAFTDLQRAQAPRSIRALSVASELLDAVMRQNGWERLGKISPEQRPFFAVSVLLTLEDVGDVALGDKALGSEWLALAFKISELAAHAGDLHKQAEAAIGAFQTKLAALASQPAGSTKPSMTQTAPDVARASASTLAALLEVSASVAPDVGIPEAPELGAAKKVEQLGEMIANGAASSTIALELSDLYLRVIGHPGPSESSKIVATVRNALPFVLQLSRAESADDVEKALEAAAAPAGAYRTKSKRGMVLITAFAGGAVGREYILHENPGYPLGLFAPVGIHASWPVSGWGNMGVMLSILNLGSLVSERLDSDLEKTSENQTSSVAPSSSDSFKKLLSPGL